MPESSLLDGAGAGEDATRAWQVPAGLRRLTSDGRATREFKTTYLPTTFCLCVAFNVSSFDLAILCHAWLQQDARAERTAAVCLRGAESTAD